MLRSLTLMHVYSLLGLFILTPSRVCFDRDGGEKKCQNVLEASEIMTESGLIVYLLIPALAVRVNDGGVAPRKCDNVHSRCARGRSDRCILQTADTGASDLCISVDTATVV